MKVAPSTIVNLEIVNTMYRAMLFFEIAVHCCGFVMTAFFFFVVKQFPVFHVNLRWVLRSFCFCFAMTSIMRSIYCIFAAYFLEELQLHSNSFLQDAEDFIIRARDTCLYAGSLHMLLVAVERFIATLRSRSYEKETHLKGIFFAMFIMWASSFSMMFIFKEGKATQYIFAALHALCDVFAICMMTYVYRSNFTLMKAERGSLPMSHGYQIRENIKSSNFLCRIFVICALLTVIGLACFVGYVYFDEPLIFRLLGFVFDLTTAIPTTLIPFLIISGHNKLRFEATSIIHRATARNSVSSVRTMDIVDFEGNAVPMKVVDEQKTYFNLYKSQWS